GAGHRRLSNHVEHRANLAALLACGVDAVLSFTVCGAVDPDAEPGSLVVFDDLHFPSNRLPDGSLCTWYAAPGGPRRGHWIFDRPFCEPLRQVLIDAAAHAGAPVIARGTYGHVDGPRFNTRSEIAALAAAGVTAVSQTAGPEVVLAGEAELPMALVGFVTDYANAVTATPEPVAALLARMAASTGVFSALAERALPQITDLPPVGVVHRFEP
ncbi:MAG: MTAP family purine nucleoside phosphorylase, partial [Streptomycetaceae bacterium]|nr:MTAP family purine nucleoside phosphorylase [Streptomycetaceae bacterium]